MFIMFLGRYYEQFVLLLLSLSDDNKDDNSQN